MAFALVEPQPILKFYTIGRRTRYHLELIRFSVCFVSALEFQINEKWIQIATTTTTPSSGNRKSKRTRLWAGLCWCRMEHLAESRACRFSLIVAFVMRIISNSLQLGPLNLCILAGRFMLISTRTHNVRTTNKTRSTECLLNSLAFFCFIHFIQFSINITL